MDEKRIKGVLFDFDGTLTLPGALDFPAIKRELDCPPDLPILEYLETVPAELKPSLMNILESKEEKAAEESLPNVGAEECLLSLRDQGLLLGIITRNSLPSVRLALARFETVRLHDFSAVITRDDSLPKPHPDGVHKACERMGLAASELMVVGDFRFDVMAGKAAGACTVLLTNGRPSVMAPGDPEPDFTVTCLEEILQLL
ncbi:MAG: HAD family hydrolase [Desulfobacteraceae bacterium]|nr:MAG: HAD family hydrolase [Desulfobacteraceae bacterium]